MSVTCQFTSRKGVKKSSVYGLRPLFNFFLLRWTVIDCYKQNYSFVTSMENYLKILLKSADIFDDIVLEGNN